jgi:hypothetical protein
MFELNHCARIRGISAAGLKHTIGNFKWPSLSQSFSCMVLHEIEINEVFNVYVIIPNKMYGVY